MSQNNNQNTSRSRLVKFHAPDKLKRQLQLLADERNISLSALLRLITSQYLKQTQAP